jgi:hypothetical protein
LSSQDIIELMKIGFDMEIDPSKTDVKALFAAPEDGSTPTVPIENDQAEVELARLRGMKVDELVLEYLGNRDRLDEERHRYNALEAEIKSKLSTMSMVMREKADALGVDAFPIRGVGTAYRNQKTSYRVAEWSQFIDWVAATNNFQCLEKRVAKLATAEVEKSIGKVPPGVDKVTEVEFLVRRNKL